MCFQQSEGRQAKESGLNGIVLLLEPFFASLVLGGGVLKRAASKEQKARLLPGVMDGSAASRDYQGGFLVDLMTKDLGLAMDTAKASDNPVPLGALAENLFKLHRVTNDAGRLD